MKIIKSLVLVSFSLGASLALQAQQPEEKTTIKALPAALTKSPAADAKSAEPVTKKIADDAIPATPSPLTRADDTKVPGMENITLKTVDANASTSQLTAEQLKTLNGTGTLPKQSAAPGTVNSKPLPLSKPAIAKEQ